MRKHTIASHESLLVNGLPIMISLWQCECVLRSMDMSLTSCSHTATHLLYILCTWYILKPILYLAIPPTAIYCIAFIIPSMLALAVL